MPRNSPVAGRRGRDRLSRSEAESPPRKKLLIVSSAVLNPANTLNSLVEMTQAALLSEIYDVALLSVWQSLPGGALEGRRRGAAWVRSPSPANFRDLADWLGTARMRAVRRHTIEGLQVFEGTANPRGQSFDDDLEAWVRGAWQAYEEYCSEHGKPDLIHAHGRFLNAGVFALQVLKSQCVPYVYVEHCSFYQRGLAPLECREVLAEVIRRSQAYAPVSGVLAKAVAKFVGDIRTPVITPNALDPGFEDQPMRPPPPSRPFRFFNASSLDEIKGIDVLLKAFAEAFAGDENVELTICGDGAQRKHFETMAGELGIDRRVTFRGWRPNDEIVQFMDDAHATVISSRVETFGVVAIESLARGRPVLATRCGGPEEIVTETDGILVRPADPAALARGMVSLVANYGQFDCSAIRDASLKRFGREAFLRRAAQISGMPDLEHARPRRPGKAFAAVLTTET
ncbi:MAG: glycosyltransferase [Phenylobacterium sp.]|nr:MAG: glycosyltransferase [Phenylobacterium sp.]